MCENKRAVSSVYSRNRLSALWLYTRDLLMSRRREVEKKALELRSLHGVQNQHLSSRIVVSPKQNLFIQLK